MSLSHTITRTLAMGSAPPLSYGVTVSDDGEIEDDIPVPAGAVNQLVGLVLPAAEVMSLFVVADQPLTLKANSSTTPAFTIALKAGSPLVWLQQDVYFPSPLTADVTALYVMNPGSVAATLKIRAITHPG